MKYIVAMLLCAAIPMLGSPVLITFTQNPVVLVSGGEESGVRAILTNTDLINTVYLNANSINVPPAFVVTDEFFTNVPLSLLPGEVTGEIELFRLYAPSDTVSDTYAVSYDLLGGVGVGSDSNFDPLGHQDLSIEVVPEPATVLTLVSGLWLLWRRREI